MVRLLHLADVHLGARFAEFGDLAAARREAHLATFRRLPAVAADNDVQAVLIAGDLFDLPDPARDTREAVLETVDRLTSDGRHVFIVPGDYDSTTLHPNPYEEPLADAYVFKDPAFGSPVSVETQAGTLHVYGFAYDPAVVEDPLSTFERSDHPGIHVALLHAQVVDAPDGPATERSLLRVELAQLAGLNVDYIALGGCHHFVSPLCHDPGNQIAACNAGSLAALDAAELGKRGFVVVELEEHLPPQVELISSGLVEIVNVGEFDITPYGSEMQVAEAIAESGDSGAIPVVELVGTPVFPLDAYVVKDELCSRVGHALVTDRSTFAVSGRLGEIADRDTILGQVVRLHRDKIDAAESAREEALQDHALRIVLKELGV
jgi:DNA repair exonuclease SbcCD nuclease subunit